MGRCASLVKPYTFVFNAHIILKQSGSTQVSSQVKPTVKCVLFQDKNFDLLCTKMSGQCFSVTANVSSILCVVCWQAIRWRLSPGNDIVVTWMMRVGSGQWVALFCCCMERLGSKILPLCVCEWQQHAKGQVWPRALHGMVFALLVSVLLFRWLSWYSHRPVLEVEYHSGSGPRWLSKSRVFMMSLV